MFGMHLVLMKMHLVLVLRSWKQILDAVLVNHDVLVLHIVVQVQLHNVLVLHDVVHVQLHNVLVLHDVVHVQLHNVRRRPPPMKLLTIPPPSSFYCEQGILS